LDDHASSITVVRRRREVGYHRLYLGFLDDPPADPPLVPTVEYILTSPPYIEEADLEGLTTAKLTTARNHRGGISGHLAGWHQAEYSSCASATRSRFYLPTPAWTSGVEVPDGCMEELPWVHAYAADDLHAGRRTPWAIFRSEWALGAAIALLDAFRNRRVLWRFPLRLMDWIRSLETSNFCSGAEGPNGETTATLEALLDLADQLPDTEAFRQRLRARTVDLRDREGWVWVDLEAGDGGTRVLVAEDLRPFDFPYTADILEARGYSHARGGRAAAVSAARGRRYTGGGSARPSSSVVISEAESSTAGPSPPAASTAASPGTSWGSHIVTFDPVEHRDIPDTAFDQLDHVPSDSVPQWFARVVPCDTGNLRGCITGTLMAGLCHTVVSLGDAIGQWARDNPWVPPRQVEGLLQLVGRRGIRAALLHQTGVAAGGGDGARTKILRVCRHGRRRSCRHLPPPADTAAAARQPGADPVTPVAAVAVADGSRWAPPSTPTGAPVTTSAATTATPSARATAVPPPGRPVLHEMCAA